MAFELEQREALSLLQGIENGTLQGTTAATRVADADPALVYLIFSWLRNRYGADHPAAEGVIGRLVELTNRHPTVKDMLDAGKTDSIVEWFEDSHAYREFTSSEFVALVVDKLES